SASSTTSTPAHTMAESARLKTGQSGSSIQSITCPWNSPGARKIRSGRFQVAPPGSRPGGRAQPKVHGYLQARELNTAQPAGMAANLVAYWLPGAVRGPAVAGRRARDAPAEQPDAGVAGDGGHHDGLGHDVGPDDERGHRQQQHYPARPLRWRGVHGEKAYL